jgi:hypothetical protein
VIPAVTEAIGIITKSYKKFLINIPGKQDFKELQKTVMLGAANTLRKALM